MKTPLLQVHQQLGARLTEFAGWQMPLDYGSVVQEHQAVRDSVGIFDVSHMGRLRIHGPEAEAFLDYLAGNRIAGKKDGTATYTVLPNEQGGSVDDTLVYREDQTHFFVVANAANRQKDLEHYQRYARDFDVTVEPQYEPDAILAVQGPQAIALMARLWPEVTQMRPFRHIQVSYEGHRFPLATTGYTGSGGVELYPPAALAEPLWKAITELGARPCGLGARDTLRLEMGYALYGHELTDEIPATESVAAWTVKTDRERFIGMERLTQPPVRQQIGLKLRDKGVARQGAEVLSDGQVIGWVCSGTHAPSLGCGIAIASIPAGDIAPQYHIQVRGRQLAAEPVSLPFLQFANKA